MKKSKRDLIFSVLSIFLITIFMFAQLSSGMAIYADTPNNNGNVTENQDGSLDGSVNNNTSSGDISATDNLTDNSGSIGTTAPSEKNDDSVMTWGWLLAVVAIIIIIAIIVAATSKKRKTEEKR